MERCDTEATLTVSLDGATTADVGPFVTALKNCSISWLFIGGTRLNDDLVIRIVNVLEYTNITTIQISNVMSYEGAVALAEILIKTKIINLQLTGSPISNEGAKFIIEGSKNTSITYLDLSEIGSTDEGALYLASGSNGTSIIHIWLARNKITNLGAEVIVNAAINYIPMQMPDLSENFYITTKKVQECTDCLKDKDIDFAF